MDNKEYNGYENSETWLISLYIEKNQYFSSEIQCLANIARNQYELANDIENFIKTTITKDENSKDVNSFLLSNVIKSFLPKVNWQELAEKYVQKNGTVFNQEPTEEFD